MKNALIAILLLAAFGAHAQTTHNDDSCDIGVYPAATLLLPYFEVDFTAPSTTATTTLVSLVNVTRTPQIAAVTLWTDAAYPVLRFDLFLTGYDVQSINLYNVLARGVVAGDSTGATEPGSRSLPNGANPNFLPSASTMCAATPASIPPAILDDVHRALTLGESAACPGTKIGLVHANAIGYATIDVVATCNGPLPNQSTYYADLLYDNVLIGDYEYVQPNRSTGNYAGGNPLVHIRAIPEGGRAGAFVETTLPYTFYDRYTPTDSRQIDRRQPLPSTFAARFIEGGNGRFDTHFTIWREGKTRGDTVCAADVFPERQIRNINITGFVRFDERENAMFLKCGGFEGCFVTSVLPDTSRRPSSSSVFPPLTTGDIGGWIFMNLNNGGSTTYSAATERNFATGSTVTGPRPSQNWVSVTLLAEGRYSVVSDAAVLANGCTPSPPGDLFGSDRNVVVGPGPNVTP